MENPCKIVFFGDSITREYTPIFEARLNEEYRDHQIEIVNAGVIGETSRDGLRRLDRLVVGRPQVAVICFGMNDWRKGVSKDELRGNLAHMIDSFEASDTRVVLATFNPDYQGPGKGTSREVDEYSDIIRELGREKRVKVADVNSLWKEKITPVQKGLRDTIHPNPTGYEVYCESLFHVVPREHTVILWQYNGRECTCNYRCPYCYYAYSSKSEDFFWGSPESWHEAFKKCFGNQRLIFYLAFGEPMLGRKFYDVVEMIGQEPKWKLRITTNASIKFRKLVRTRVAREGRLYVNASFHPTQVGIEKFLKQLHYLRKHGIEAPVVYVMWPPHLGRFKSDFTRFYEHNYLVHVRRFAGEYKGKYYPRDYTDEERRFVARYCDDATIKYMLNEKPVLDRRTYAGMHFFIVDATGNVGYDSDCFNFYSKYRTMFGNVIQHHMFKPSLQPLLYPEGYQQGTVDGVSNWLENGYHQLEGNNILSFARQGGVYHTDTGVFYKNIDRDFVDKRTREQYHFPSI